jgi:hypothetical protein
LKAFDKIITDKRESSNYWFLSKALFNRGFTLLEIGRYRDAKASFEKGVILFRSKKEAFAKAIDIIRGIKTSF